MMIGMKKMEWFDYGKSKDWMDVFSLDKERWNLIGKKGNLLCMKRVEPPQTHIHTQRFSQPTNNWNDTISFRFLFSFQDIKFGLS